MCYSAMVKQQMKKLGFNWESRTQLDLFEDLFRRRLEGEKIIVSPALESSFLEPTSESETRIKNYIEAFRAKRISEEEEELFGQIKRRSDAERKLQSKPTKTAQKEIDVATRQIDRIKFRLQELNSTPDSQDARIWSKYYAPLIVWEDGERVIKPMRYLCRPMGFPEDFDKNFPGCYNARRDSLKTFWKKQYKQKHAILVVSSFFENVKLHDLERRPLKGGEKETNVIIEFKPDGFEEMIIPCIWDRWEMPGQAPLYSFALITDNPPEEVREAGHDRCPIFLKASNVDRWLNPTGLADSEIESLLDDKETPLYRHQKTA